MGLIGKTAIGRSLRQRDAIDNRERCAAKLLPHRPGTKRSAKRSASRPAQLVGRDSDIVRYVRKRLGGRRDLAKGVPHRGVQGERWVCRCQCRCIQNQDRRRLARGKREPLRA